MLIREIGETDPNQARLAALAKFLLGRAKDVGSDKRTISTDAFIRLAQQQGISLTADQLKDLSQIPPLSNLISDVQGDEISGTVVFKGGEETPATMPVDQAKATVDSMAKRAAKKAI